LIHQVDLVPESGEPSIVLHGGLAAMLSFAASKKPSTVSDAGSLLASRASLGHFRHIASTSFPLPATHTCWLCVDSQRQ